MATTELVTFTPTTAVDLDEVRAFHVDGPESCELAIAYREDVKALVAEIEAGYRPYVAQAHAMHKSLLGELNTRLAPAKAALDALTRAIGAYELGRRQREQQAQREAEAAAQAQAEADRAKDAAAQRAKGDEALAKAIEQSPIEEFMGPVLPVVTQKASGVAVTQSFTFEVTDLEALLTFAAGPDVTPQLRALLVQPNERGLQSLVMQMGASFSVPGVTRVAKAPTVRSTRR